MPVTQFPVASDIEVLLDSADAAEGREALALRRTESAESIDVLDFGTVGGWVWARTSTATSPDGSFLSPYMTVQNALDALHRKINFTGEHTVDVSAMSGEYHFRAKSSNGSIDDAGIYFTGTPLGALTIYGNGKHRMYVSGDLLDCPGAVTIENAAVPSFQLTVSDVAQQTTIATPGLTGIHGVLLTIRHAITGSILSAAGRGGQGCDGDGDNPGTTGGVGGSGNGIVLDDCIGTAPHSCPAGLGGAPGADGGAGTGTTGAVGTPSASSYAFNSILTDFSGEGHSGNGGFIRYQGCRVAGVFIVDTSYFTGFGSIEARTGAVYAAD